MTYQGWKNYATWNAVLWLGNDEEAYKLVMSQIVFTVTQQHKKTAGNYADAISSAARRRFGNKTPDGVALSPRTEVDWEDAARYFDEDIKGLETEWLDVLEKLPKNAQGGFVGIVEAADAFRKKHAY